MIEVTLQMFLRHPTHFLQYLHFGVQPQPIYALGVSAGVGIDKVLLVVCSAVLIAKGRGATVHSSLVRVNGGPWSALSLDDVDKGGAVASFNPKISPFVDQTSRVRQCVGHDSLDY